MYMYIIIIIIHNVYTHQLDITILNSKNHRMLYTPSVLVQCYSEHRKLEVALGWLKSNHHTPTHTFRNVRMLQPSI